MSQPAARRQPRKVALFPPHPREAVARLHGNGHARDQLPPRGAARQLGLPVDEGREPHARERGELGDQLTRDHLHAARLAGHEVDEIEADVHQRPAATRARR